MRDLKIPEQRHPEKARRPDNPQPKKPSWIRVKAPGGKGYADTAKIMRENKLVTVCEEAGCPNVGECWSQGHATMMIMGEVCTRACTFCNFSCMDRIWVLSAACISQCGYVINIDA